MEKAPMLLWLQISHFQIQIHNKHSNFLVLKPTQLDNHRTSISKLSFLLSSMELLHKTTAFSWTHTISTSLHLPQPLLSLVSTHFLYFLFFYIQRVKALLLSLVYLLTSLVYICGFRGMRLRGSEFGVSLTNPRFVLQN